MPVKTMKREEMEILVAKHYEVTQEEIAGKTDDELLFLVNKLDLPAEAPQRQAKPKKVATEAAPVKRHRIIIHEQDGIDGHDDVVIGVQGNVAQIKREHEVELTDEQMHVLDNAVYRRFEPIRDKPGEYVERTVKRFNYTNLGPAVRAA